MRKYWILIIIVPFILSACKSPFVFQNIYNNWHNIAVAEGVEIYVDTTSIKPMGAVTYAFEKRVYTTPEAKEAYVGKIRERYASMGKPEKADKWADFSYNIYYSLYDCSNQRFRVLLVEDYDSKGNRIVRTNPPKGELRWLKVDRETVGDYTFFFVCDYSH